jgi:hypothetical protein
MLTKALSRIELNWTSFYSNAAIIFSVIGVTGTLISLVYFSRKYRAQNLD